MREKVELDVAPEKQLGATIRQVLQQLLPVIKLVCDIKDMEGDYQLQIHHGRELHVWLVPEEPLTKPAAASTNGKVAAAKALPFVAHEPGKRRRRQ